MPCLACQREEAVNTFVGQLPPLYRTTVADRLPCQAESQAALGWDPIADGAKGRLGLFLWGASRTGKTRTACLVAKAQVRLRSKPPVIMRGQALAREIISRTRPDGPGGLDQVLAEWCRTRLLVIDEVDKIGTSPRVVAEFFDLLESRLADCGPMLFTSNLGLDPFIERFPPDLRDPLRGRMQEFFHPIHFT
jgi:DNA replication protein DnaC